MNAGPVRRDRGHWVSVPGDSDWRQTKRTVRYRGCLSLHARSSKFRYQEDSLHPQATGHHRAVLANENSQEEIVASRYSLSGLPCAPCNPPVLGNKPRDRSAEFCGSAGSFPSPRSVRLGTMTACLWARANAVGRSPVTVWLRRGASRRWHRRRLSRLRGLHLPRRLEVPPGRPGSDTSTHTR